MIRRHLTYANVMSTIAVFVVMGGSAYALAKHSVGTKQLKNKAVTTKKIKNGAVTGAKIAAGAVPATGFNVTVTSAAGPTITPGNVGGATATCPAGKKAIAGGGLSDGTNNGAYIEDSRPVNGTTGSPTAGGTFTGWRVIWQNQTGATNKTPTVYVVCLG
jgi:hypothetical protein